MHLRNTSGLILIINNFDEFLPPQSSEIIGEDFLATILE